MASLSTFRRLVAAVALAALMALALPGAALAQCPQTSLGEVEKEVFCPVCGTPLALATEAPQAQRQREFIIKRVEGCESKDEIKAALVAEFGDDVVGTPGDGGFDLVGYLLPALAVLAGGGGIAFAAIRWRRGRAAREPLAAGAGGSVSSAAEAARLDRDLERYDL